MPPRYSEWLTLIFDHEPSTPQWCFDTDSPYFSGADQEIAELFTWTMSHCGKDLLQFSDDQVGEGLDYFFNPSCSNLSFSIRDGKYNWEMKLAAIRSIGHLYSDCFAVRCSSADLFDNEPGKTKLDTFCYMLWDVCPLNYWEGLETKVKGYDAVVDVMEAALSLKSRACVVSAIHGLGHTRFYSPDRIAKILDQFISNNQDFDSKILDYAEDAAYGCIQ